MLAAEVTTEAPRPVPYVDLAAQYAAHREEVLAVVDRVFASGKWVGGPDVAALEQEVAAAVGTAHAVALNSGTDALILAMRALGIGPGDEVITPPNSFIASTAAIVQLGATPVFADVQEDGNVDPACVEAAVTPRTKAVMPVHLTGRVADMDVLGAIARDRGLAVVEDAAQAFGATYRGTAAGAFGDVGCFSAHPLKNLNAFGDAGFVTTDRPDIAEAIRRLANHGLTDRDHAVRFGGVSRMDSLQAALLRLKLAGLGEIVDRRRAHAALYRARLDPDRVFLPDDEPHRFSTYHTLVVQVDRRDELRDALAAAGIGTAIHYPIPIHLQEAARELGYRRGDLPVAERQAGRILSLPVHQILEDDDIERVAVAVNGFFA